MKTKTLLLLIFMTLIVIFSLQNSESTNVDFLFWSISLSRVIVILGSFGLGVIAGLLVSAVNKKPSNKRNDSKNIENSL